MPSSLFQNQPTLTSSSNLDSIRQLYNLVRNNNNPTLMLQNLAETNPQVKSALELVKQYGGNPQAAFFALAKQKGVDPNQILNILK